MVSPLHLNGNRRSPTPASDPSNSQVAITPHLTLTVICFLISACPPPQVCLGNDKLTSENLNPEDEGWVDPVATDLEIFRANLSISRGYSVKREIWQVRARPY